MSNPWFKCKQFEIKQDHCAQKVGTDSFLLGAWVNLNNAVKVLDIGTGTGILSLMCAQRSNATITAIEIDKDAFAQSVQNINSSPWAYRIHVFNQSLKQFETCREEFDVIISNPPYFQHSLTSPNCQRTMARHACTLTLNDIVAFSDTHLTKAGQLSLIIPVMLFDEFMEMISSKKWFAYRITKVFPKPGKEAHRILITCGKKEEETKYNQITIETTKRHIYTPEFYALTNEFYLEMNWTNIT